MDFSAFNLSGKRVMVTGANTGIGQGIALPKHVRADGWRNAWFVSEPGTLIVFNAIDVVIIAGLLLGLGVIGWQVRYGRS